MMTPRDPDRYEEKAREIAAWFHDNYPSWPDLSDRIAAALRAAEAEALEWGARIADNEACALDEGDQYIKAAHRLAGKLRQLKPATAPAAETGKVCGENVPHSQNSCTRDRGHADEHRCSVGDVDDRAAGKRAPPSEPAAPAPPKMDEDGCCVVCGRGLEPCYACAPAPSAAEKRIAELEERLREAREWIRGEGSIVPERLVARIDAALAAATPSKPGDGSAET